jgi:hypothetical protein
MKGYGSKWFCPEILYQNLPGTTEENHKKPKSRRQASWLRSEVNTS